MKGLTLKSVAAVLLSLSAAGCPGTERGAAGEDAAVMSRYVLDPAKVPVHLQELIPLAEKWGIGDDVERGEFIERASPEERQALRSAVAPYQAPITAWLDSFGSRQLSDEAAAFMYMQLAIEELPPD